MQWQVLKVRCYDFCDELSNSFLGRSKIRTMPRLWHPVPLPTACLLTMGHDNAYTVVIMARPASLGEFEQIVLLAILRLGENAYGVTIRAEIAAHTKRKPAPGALYTTLDRMEEKGLVVSRMGDPTPQRGGRAKRYITVTKKGRVAVISAQRSYRSLLQGLGLLEGANA